MKKPHIIFYTIFGIIGIVILLLIFNSQDKLEETLKSYHDIKKNQNIEGEVSNIIRYRSALCLVLDDSLKISIPLHNENNCGTNLDLHYYLGIGDYILANGGQFVSVIRNRDTCTFYPAK